MTATGYSICSLYALGYFYVYVWEHIPPNIQGSPGLWFFMLGWFLLNVGIIKALVKWMP